MVSTAAMVAVGVLGLSTTAGAESASPSTSATPGPAVSVAPSTVNPGSDVTAEGTCPKDSKTVNLWYRKAGDTNEALSVTKDLTLSEEDLKVSRSLAVTTSTSPGSYEVVMQCVDKDKKETGTYTAPFTVAKGGTEAGGGGMSGDNGNMYILFGGGMLAAAAICGAIYMGRRSLVTG